MRALLVAAAFAAALPAAEATERQWNFRVLLDDREIGWHRYVVREQGDAVEVASEARLDVRVLFVDVYAYRHEAHERWQGDCLASLASRTETNGELERVAASSRGGDLVVDGPGGLDRLDGCVMSFAYWNPRILGETRLLNPQTGEVLPVTVTPHGDELVTAGGQRLAATRHRLAGPGLEIDLWYAGGSWIALEAPAAGGRRLRYELQ